MTEKEGWAFAG